MTFFTVAFFIGAMLLISKLFGMRRRASTSNKLRLRGLEPESEFELSKCPIQATMETLVEAGLENAAAPCLVSRLEWWKQINSYLDTLEDTPESISIVATAIEVLLTYHQLQRSEVEEDLVRALFQRALQDSGLSHVYAKLLKEMINDTRDWTQDLTSRFFQLAVAEFNRPLTHVEDFEKKLSNVKLMAAVFRRRIDGVPDEWMTDCSDTLVQRLHAGLEQSTEQLCLFLKTLLISECNDNCNLSMSQQLELTACFEALQKAALCPKGRQSLPRLEADVPIAKVHEKQTETQSEPEKEVEEQFETPSGTQPEIQPETEKSEVEEIKTKKADLEQNREETSSTAESHNRNYAETPQANPLDRIASFGYQLFQGTSVVAVVPKDKICRPLSSTLPKNTVDPRNRQTADDVKPGPFKARPVPPTQYNEPYRPTLSKDRPITKRIPVSKKPMTVPEMEPSLMDDKKLEGGENQSEQNVPQPELDEDSLRIRNSNASTISDSSDNSSVPDVFDITPIENKAQVEEDQPIAEAAKIQVAHNTVEASLLADNVQVPKRETQQTKRSSSDSELLIHPWNHWYEDPGEAILPFGLTSNDVAEVGEAVLLADKTMIDDKKSVVGLRDEKNPEGKGKSIKKKDTSGSDVVEIHQKIHRRQTRNVKWIFPSSRI